VHTILTTFSILPEEFHPSVRLANKKKGLNQMNNKGPPSTMNLYCVSLADPCNNGHLTADIGEKLLSHKGGHAGRCIVARLVQDAL
jgi:hypothetical protein